MYVFKCSITLTLCSCIVSETFYNGFPTFHMHRYTLQPYIVHTLSWD